MWKSVHYEERGRSHVATGTPCQDKTLSLRKHGVDVIALADGAGSAQYSHYGAETVIHTAADYISENFATIANNPDGRQVKLELLDVLQLALAQKKEQLQCELKDLASTLLLVAVYEHRFIMLHIGDGVIGYIKEDVLKVASSPENGEFANTTTFVTSSNAALAMKLFKGKIDGIAGFVLMSDGTAESLYHKQSNSLVPALLKIIHRNSIISRQRMYALVEESFHNVIIPNTIDDCSIAILSRTIGSLTEFEYMSTLQKCEFLQINPIGKSSLKRIKRYDRILVELKQPKTEDEISRVLRLKRQYASRHLQRLLDAGLILQQDGTYRTTNVKL